MIRFVAIALACFALGACAVGPDYERPAPLSKENRALLEARNNANITVKQLPDQWWQLFDDPVLDGLVEKALGHNNDIRVAFANLKQARAALFAERASRLPFSEVTASGVQERTAGTNRFPANVDDFYSAGFDASYEVDVFGGVSRAVEAARADYEASQAALDVTRVSVAAETARLYALACALGSQSKAARESVRLLESTLDLTQRLLAGGRGTQRDVDQILLLVEQARSQIPQFEGERRAALYGLTVLTGDYPHAINPDAAQCDIAPTVRQKIPVGDGESLLARRPDIRQAERLLAADVARVGVATAALYPSIQLLGSISLSANDLGNLGDNSSLGYSVGPFISWNFPFNGAARAQVRANEAIAEGSLASFDQTVLVALQETEQALARLSGAIEREASLRKAFDAAHNAARISRIRYDYGADSFLQLLDSERSRVDVLASLVQSQSDRAAAQVALFKALGGGWQSAPVIDD
ncbi:efflux transporter outer membrane subunit [Parasphingorhabdus cellanae]|uniref:Efflux transporter outer membrane subunit n=1 Tax=Parasphingorhabdus cellanae TaxID=2806553 RepID=A0ABX7SYW9_9SPHN|nr:efflux transporter outer membrane subunit [Parasphingorhabdus cellanae]QTD54445.1 efflux transporter outer membrane subunit [Parasphingorhabdus cellanae]